MLLKKILHFIRGAETLQLNEFRQFVYKTQQKQTNTT